MSKFSNRYLAIIVITIRSKKDKNTVQRIQSKDAFKQYVSYLSISISLNTRAKFERSHQKVSLKREISFD
jgi:hypothetical protein